MNRPDPRQFGRARVAVTCEQFTARVVACSCFAVFVGCIGLGLLTQSPAGAAVMVVLAFGALCVGIAAAGEA